MTLEAEDECVALLVFLSVVLTQVVDAAPCDRAQVDDVVLGAEREGLLLRDTESLGSLCQQLGRFQLACRPEEILQNAETNMWAGLSEKSKGNMVALLCMVRSVSVSFPTKKIILHHELQVDVFQRLCCMATRNKTT